MRECMWRKERGCVGVSRREGVWSARGQWAIYHAATQPVLRRELGGQLLGVVSLPDAESRRPLSRADVEHHHLGGAAGRRRVRGTRVVCGFADLPTSTPHRLLLEPLAPPASRRADLARRRLTQRRCLARHRRCRRRRLLLRALSHEALCEAWPLSARRDPRAERPRVGPRRRRLWPERRRPWRWRSCGCRCRPSSAWRRRPAGGAIDGGLEERRGGGGG